VGGAIAADNLTESALAGNAEVLTDLRRLPCTRGEAEAVGALFGEGATILVGTRASEQEMVRMATAGQLQQYRVLHLATHALVDDKRPERSALVLSQVGLPDKLEAALAGTRIYDGCLSAQEVVREWKLDADLVTLSACETALGKRVAGEGYIGLAHAFLQAGARSLLVSLWSVEDRSTSLLMQRFYENWLGRYEGVREMPPGGESRDRGTAMTKAEALQEAKHWLREYTTPNGRHPYSDPSYWAGFILIGQKD
jgi:CHAT domain-containing protein